MADQMNPERRLNELNERSTARARARVESMPAIEALPLEPITTPDLAGAINKLPMARQAATPDLELITVIRCHV